MAAPEPGDALDLSAPRRLHVIGVGGAGMSAYTTVLAQLGHRVSGSDLKDSPRFHRLRLLGVDCRVPQSKENVPLDADAVVVSSAVPEHNVEVRAARDAAVPVVSRADALAGIVAQRRAVGVAGTHGKTTTSSMITLVLRAAGMRPSFIIGSELNEVGTNAALDTGEWMVVECDESDGTFLHLSLDAAVVTNVHHDHLWYWGSEARLRDAFTRFAGAVDGPLVVCADDPPARALLAVRPDARTYGAAPDAHYRVTRYEGGPEGSRFELWRDGAPLGELRLPVLGAHHAQNAAGAAAMAMELGASFDAVRTALMGFGGVARRFQVRGERDGVTYVDDYALLPEEVDATIRAAREGGWRRVVAVFQPFRYARTAIMWREFADAFTGADQVVLTDVCGFHEQPVPGVTGHLLMRAVLDAHPDLPVAYFPHRGELAERVPRLARPGDVVLTLGGGDITTLADEVLAGPPRPRTGA